MTCGFAARCAVTRTLPPELPLPGDRDAGADHILIGRRRAVRSDIGDGGGLAVLQHDACLHRLAPFFVGDADNRAYIGKLAVAFLITAVLGLVVKKLGFSLPDEIGPIAWALLIGGVWMLAAEWQAGRRPSQNQILWTVAIVVGLAQVIAGVFPGTSRSASTIFAAMLVGGASRAAATEFAFLVGIPTMYAASAYELYGEFKHGGEGHEDWTAVIVGFVVSAVVAFIAVTWLLRYIQSHRYTVFAWYRIAL
eukprot:gene6012-7660_t